MNDAFFGIAQRPDTLAAFSDTAYTSDLAPQPAGRPCYFWRKGSSGSTNAADIEKRTGVAVSPVVIDDIAVLPGDAATPQIVERAKNKERLLALIQQFADDGFSSAPDRDGRISHDTAKAAKALFDILLPNYELPKVSPDGEGGLIAVWEQGNHSTVLVIDGWQLHLVAEATTPRARYFDDMAFDGERVPDPVVKQLPTR